MTIELVMLFLWTRYNMYAAADQSKKSLTFLLRLG